MVDVLPLGLHEDKPHQIEDALQTPLHYAMVIQCACGIESLLEVASELQAFLSQWHHLLLDERVVLEGRAVGQGSEGAIVVDSCDAGHVGSKVQ